MDCIGTASIDIGSGSGIAHPPLYLSILPYPTLPTASHRIAYAPTYAEPKLQKNKLSPPQPVASIHCIPLALPVNFCKQATHTHTHIYIHIYTHTHRGAQTRAALLHTYSFDLSFELLFGWMDSSCTPTCACILHTYMINSHTVSDLRCWCAERRQRQRQGGGVDGRLSRQHSLLGMGGVYVWMCVWTLGALSGTIGLIRLVDWVTRAADLI
ncbi:hypothetical protein K504DRAFT_155971 [Pleomassaria siparia CBS 279.74]|uniref:Uncharacterized protein n=1 Tax=Pleomassaria siparia CBS 279.74 TaxID=1314801 RepID=A0A6G1KMQ4_9PLEO|nr:hypothetical protein K504DRAFT_155971 [Pleomassaria siparia CBS 279.74]